MNLTITLTNNLEEIKKVLEAKGFLVLVRENSNKKLAGIFSKLLQSLHRQPFITASYKYNNGKDYILIVGENENHMVLGYADEFNHTLNQYVKEENLDTVMNLIHDMCNNIVHSEVEKENVL